MDGAGIGRVLVVGGALVISLSFFHLSMTSRGPGSTVKIAALGQMVASGRLPRVPSAAGYALLSWPFVSAASLIAVLFRRPAFPLAACLIAGSSVPLSGLLTARADVAGGGAAVACLAWGVQLVGAALLIPGSQSSPDRGRVVPITEG